MSSTPAVEALVQTATGPFGLVVVFIYSFLVAFVLPLPGELVLVPAVRMDLGIPVEASIALVIVASAAGKALGSLAALHIGHEASSTGPVQQLTDRLPGFRTLREGRAVDFVRRYGYAGMILLLAVPFTPDTVTVYAFSVVETSEIRFAVAAFVGTLLRLLVALGLATGLLALV